MYTQNLKKYNIAINNLNREVNKLKQALFAKTKKCQELQKKNEKLLSELSACEKQIKTLKNASTKTEKQEIPKVRNYKKKK